tara:strand:- start:83 stop:1258 length:1176 start_codon:yes stop_codon:yes gene_type:complete
MICSTCVLDDDSADLTFDQGGVCNYCNDYKVYNDSLPNLNSRKSALTDVITQIKKDGRNQKYDCLIGLSGGIDSSFLAYLVVKEYRLRPLAVHFDNGWNTELAVANVNNIVEGLNLDLKTFVMDWETFKDIQLSYLRASVVDIEVPTDNFIYGTMYRFARENKIKYILSGFNSSTEFIMPKGWNARKDDLANIIDIHKQHGTGKIIALPKFGYKQKLFYKFFSNIKQVNPLDLICYNISEAKTILKEKLKWRDYGGKHHESVWTRFYQGYILPKKFNIDKRKAHLSNLICSGQMTRQDAIAALSEEPYPKQLQDQDMEYIKSKLEISEDDFKSIMNTPIRSHSDYDSDGKKYETWSIRITLILSILHYIVRPIHLLRYLKYRIHLKFHSDK